MRLLRSRDGLLIALILGLSACQGTPLPHGQQSPRPTATAPQSAPDPQRCERLARRGFTPCPPTPDRLQLPPTTIRNATNGAVSDATAQQWGRAFQLAQAYYYWILDNGARAGLTSGTLADNNPTATANLFSNDLMDIDNASRQHGILLVQPLRMTSSQLVTVPASLKDAMLRQGLTPSSYAFAVHFVGPNRRAIRLSDGKEIELTSSDASYSADVLIWGDFKGDQDLGLIWYEHGNYGCDGSVRSVCQS
jgi:hypothetical protein